MFGKKKKLRLMLLDEARSLVKDISIDDIILKEKYIIAQSTEKYGTDEPCIIYRTCIADDLHLQLSELFKKLMDDNINEVSVDDIPKELSYNIELDEAVKYIGLIMK